MRRKLFTLVLSSCMVTLASAQNLIKNSDMQEQGVWKVSDLDTQEEKVSVTFGADVISPAGGSGTSLEVTIPERTSPAQVFIYQEVTLKANTTYKLDGLFKDNSSELKNFWCELLWGVDTPAVGIDYGGTPVIAFNTWDACGAGVDGNFVGNACKGNLEGYFTTHDTIETFTAFVGINVGIWTDEATGPVAFDVILDNISLTDSAGATSVNDKHLTKNKISNYPNPADFETTFNYSISNSGTANISVYDLTGKKLMTVLDENVIAGDYTKTVNTSALAAGTYFYTLSVDGYSITKKLTIIK